MSRPGTGSAAVFFFGFFFWGFYGSSGVRGRAA
jgi:hypothetical protein